MTTDRRFEYELEKRKIAYKKLDNRLYEISTVNGPRTISTQNLDRNFMRDQDANVVVRFVDNILQPASELPEWNIVKHGIYVALEGADLVGVTDFVHRKLSDRVFAVLAYYDDKVNQIHFLTPLDLKKLDVSPETAWNEAQENLDAILSTSKVTFNNIGEEKLGMIEVHEPHKASLILSKNLKLKVMQEIGWPVFAVAPARDFVYLFSKQGGLVNRVGSVVVKEFKESGYPISTEVWELSDDGAHAIGEFPVQ